MPFQTTKWTICVEGYTLAPSRSHHFCNGTATVHSLYIFVSVDVDFNNICVHC